MTKFKLIILIFSLLSLSTLIGVTISEIVITGNETVSRKEILDKLDFKVGDEVNFKQINDSNKTIIGLYSEKELNFIDVKQPEIIPISSSQVRVEFVVIELSLNIVKAYEFKGNYAIKSSILSSILYSHNYKTKDIPYMKKLILDEYLERGYFFTTVNIESIAESGAGAELIFRIKENKPFVHRFTQFKGNEVTKGQTLVKIAKLDNERNISPSIMNKYKNRILTKEYIRTCDVYPIDFETLLIDVEESSMSKISGIAGYNSNNEDYPLTGFVDFTFMNLFGTDRSINFKWNKLQSEQSQIELAYHDSGLLKYDFSSDISVKRTEYDTLANQTELDFALNYDFQSNQFGLLLGYTSYQVTSSSLDEESETINSIGGFWKFKEVDDINNPLIGQEFTVEFNYNSSSTQNSGYNTTKGLYGRFIPLSNNITIYNRISACYSTKKDLKSYLEFKVGGFSSLRGFQQEQFSGYLTLLNNCEIRYIFGEKNNLFVFGDVAYLEYQRESIDTKKGNLFSTGVGMRLSTKLGMLTFEYALGYDEKWTSIADGLIHFGLETSF